MCECVCALQTCASAHTGIRGQSQVLVLPFHLFQTRSVFCTHDCVEQASETLGSQMCTTSPALLGV